ncbi:MAG: hypothetical protein H6974_15365 [Gammaproteobacteria bacterium]|nr:hypothetical protein [Gammaproteobacteria bacterium]
MTGMIQKGQQIGGLRASCPASKKIGGCFHSTNLFGHGHRDPLIQGDAILARKALSG